MYGTVGSKEDLTAKRVLIYNRVGKTGSATLKAYLRQAGHELVKENIDLWTVKASLSQFCDHLKVEDMKDGSLEQRIYSGHFRHVELVTSCNNSMEKVRKVVWFNQLRDPVEKFISRYHYVRTESHIAYARKLGRTVNNVSLMKTTFKLADSKQTLRSNVN